MPSSDEKFTLRTSHIPHLMYNYLDNRGTMLRYVPYMLSEGGYCNASGQS
jgi:hypothetical protein